MANQGGNNIKLGVFVIIGLAALIFSFYMIGKNRNLFGANFELKVHFSNLNGLIEGDNVLFSGIQAGTVKTISMVNDSTIEVVLLIDDSVKPFLHKNAVAAIGTEGLMGDKVVNISPGKGISPLVKPGDLLSNREIVSTDELLQTLSSTGKNIETISEALKGTVLRINNSSVWNLLNDKALSAGIKSTLNNVNRASVNANKITGALNDIVDQVKHGKGAAGALLADTGLSSNLNEAIAKIKSAGNNVDRLTDQLNGMVKEINGDLTDKRGTVHLLLKDTTLAKNLSATMENVKKGADNFNQDMEALKHNFLFRGYFKDQEKKQKKAKAVSQ
jgi:phospholipid/cholesterol/gamma-HCH transport system substrate-binding protein